MILDFEDLSSDLDFDGSGDRLLVSSSFTAAGRLVSVPERSEAAALEWLALVSEALEALVEVLLEAFDEVPGWECSDGSMVELESFPVLEVWFVVLLGSEEVEVLLLEVSEGPVRLVEVSLVDVFVMFVLFDSFVEFSGYVV